MEAELAARTGEAVPVYVGMRNWRPYIPEVVRQMRADGIEEAAVICMAPQNSRTSVGLYRRAVEAEAGGLRIDFTEGGRSIRCWPRRLPSGCGRRWPSSARRWASRCRCCLRRTACRRGRWRPGGRAKRHRPRLWPGQGAIPMHEEARHTAELVAERVPEISRWWFAFQSQGASGGPWMGPSVEETLDRLAA